MKKVAVLGGGISGLTLCYFLQKKAQVTLFEPKKIGGWIQTIEKDGFLFECGPRSLRTSGKETWNLIKELGLENQVIFADPSCKRRYLMQQGKLKQVSPLTSFTFWKGLLKMAFHKNLEDETIYSFGLRNFGEDFTNTYFDALVKGIYAGDMRKLSMKSCFPNLFAKKFSYPFGEKLYSFKNGLKTLPEALFNRLDVEIRQEKICDLNEFSHIYSTIPSYELFPLLQDEMLLNLPYASITTLHLGYHHQIPIKKGFGYLIPGNSDLLGCVFDSNVFPEQKGKVRLTLMFKGTDLTDSQILSLSPFPSPTIYHISRAEKAIPQYPLNHDLWMQKLTNKYKNITFLGSAFSGVSVNECLRKILYLQ